MNTTDKPLKIIASNQAAQYPIPKGPDISFRVVTTVESTLRTIARQALGSNYTITHLEVRDGYLLVAGVQTHNGLYPQEKAIRVQTETPKPGSDISVIREGIPDQVIITRPDTLEMLSLGMSPYLVNNNGDLVRLEATNADMAQVWAHNSVQATKILLLRAIA